MFVHLHSNVFEYVYFNKEFRIIVVLEPDKIVFGYKMDSIDNTLHFLCVPKLNIICQIYLYSKKQIGDDILNITGSTEPDKSIEIKDEKSFLDFIEKNLLCIFLHFVKEVEFDNGVFSTDRDISLIRKRLKESHVYRLINAKTRYNNFLTSIQSESEIKKDGNIYIEKTYNKYVGEYVDLLTYEKINKILPKDKLGEKLLFDNPEAELQRICDEKNSVILHETLRIKIEDFFLKRYATISACSFPHKEKKDWWKNISWILLIMGIWNIFMLLCLSPPACCYSLFFWLLPRLFVLGVLLFGVYLFTSPHKFPFRIFIALLGTWFPISISGDFIVSQINRSGEVYFFIASVFFVCYILYNNARANSPHYKLKKELCTKNKYNKKIFPILIYSLSLTFFIGALIHILVIPNVINSSQTLPSIVFNTEFSHLEQTKSGTKRLIEKLENYKIEESAHRPSAKGHATISAIDSTKLYSQEKIEDAKFDSTEVRNYDRTKFLMPLLGDTVYLNSSKVLLKSLSAKLKEEHESVSNSTALLVDSLIITLNIDLVSIEKFYYKYNNSMNIQNFIRYNFKATDISDESQRAIYRQFFGPNIENKNKNIAFLGFFIYPKLLLFHSSIAMLVAFCLQLLSIRRSIIESI